MRQSLQPQPGLARRPPRRVRRPGMRSRAEEMGEEQRDHDLPRELGVRPVAGLDPREPGDDRAHFVTHLHRHCHIRRIPLPRPVASSADARSHATRRHPGLSADRAVAGRPLRRRPARPAALARPRAGLRRGLQPARGPRARVLRAARRARRAPVLDVARRTSMRCPSRSPTASASSPRAAATTTRARATARRRSPSRSPSCASRARATCSPSSTGCAARWPPRASSRRRSGSPRPRCRAASASSRASTARRATTSSPACAAEAGPAGSSGPSRRCRTATRRPPSRARCRISPPARRSRS